MIKENQRLLNQVNVLSDISIMFLSMLGAFFIRFDILPYAEGGYMPISQYMILCCFMVPVQLLIFVFYNLYDSFRSKSFRKEAIAIVKADTFLVVIFLVVMSVFQYNYSRLTVIFFYLINLSVDVLKRFILRKSLYKLRSRGKNLKHVIIIGSGGIAHDYLKAINEAKQLGYKYCGYISDDEDMWGKRLGDYSRIMEILNENKPDEVVCALDIKDADKLEGIMSTCEHTGTKISIIPFCYKYIPSQPYIDQIAGVPLINLRRIPLDNLGNAFMKRAMDIVGSLILIIITSPIMLFTAIGVKLTSKGPVIFKQERVGLNKKTFTMYKFRSMKVNDKQNTGWTTESDPRKTKFGSFIRKFSIDELPQFFNVLMGDMSLVGPRPEVPHYVETFQESIPLYMVKHQVKPGITGWAQVNGYRGDTSIEKRIEHDIYYIENWDIFFDMNILLKTVLKGFKNNEKITGGK